MAENRARSAREAIGYFLKRAFALVAVSTAMAYFGDYGLLRFRIATGKNPFGTVTVTPYYAVPRKDKKVEFIFDDPRDETCVNSLFPHLGDSPCWYLRAHQQKRIDL
jgi:hypothetical protein